MTTQERTSLINEMLICATNLEAQGIKKAADLMYQAASELKSDTKYANYNQWLKEQADLDCGRE